MLQDIEAADLNIKMIENEVHLLRSLSHPHIVTYLAAYQHADISVAQRPGCSTGLGDTTPHHASLHHATPHHSRAACSPPPHRAMPHHASPPPHRWSRSWPAAHRALFPARGKKL